MSKRVGVFVDIIHQFKAAQDKHGKKINYQKYLDLAKGDGMLYYAIAYGVQLKSEADGFIRRLKAIGYDTKYSQAVETDEYGKINLSASDFLIEMIIDVIRVSDRLDKVVLGSNDPRLITLIRYLRERGLEVQIYACQIPPELIVVASSITEIPDECFEKGKI